jgi:hypothetical protein
MRGVAGVWAVVVAGVAATAQAPAPAMAPAPAPAEAPGVVVEITAPAERQVVQRGDDDAALVAVRGRVAGPATRIFVRARPRPGVRGEALPWRPLEGSLARDGRFSGRVRLAAGGWYELQLCAVHGGRPGPVATVGRVGVGEVFLVAGQSNISNSGDLDRAHRVDDRVSAFDGEAGAWARGGNPMPFAPGAGGCMQAYLGNRLVRELGVPVAFCTLSWAMPVEAWLPGAVYPRAPKARAFRDLVVRLAALRDRGGLRAVLWHQGETDFYTPIPDYARRLTSLIVRSRAAAELDVPWVIARVCYGPGRPGLPAGADPCDPTIRPPTIRLAQCEVARTVPRCYPGPTTDDLGPAFRETKHRLHLNVRGLAIHGDRWAEVLLHTPGLLPPAPVAAPSPAAPAW